MNIVTIFEPSLYAVKYDDFELNEFDRAFQFCSDLEELYNFFKENEKDLNYGFYSEYSIEEASEIVYNEAQDLLEKLLEYAESGENNGEISLNNLFRPLKNNEYYSIDLQKSKTRNSRKGMLRIYAIKIDFNTFLITGFAIKLTKLMEEREHTIKELKKIDRVKDFLKEKFIIDRESFKKNR